jgi:hypothetical protein
MYRDLDGQRRGEITLSQSFVALKIWANLPIHTHTHFASFHCLSNPIYPPVREVFPMHYLCQERLLNSIISFFKVQLQQNSLRVTTHAKLHEELHIHPKCTSQEEILSSES